MWFLVVNLVRHLECFVAVAEESHFGRAAARVGMAQPPLSQCIQRLERELGVRLFERSSRRVVITDAGALLLAEARELVARSEAFMATARRVRDGETGLLRAALTPDIAGETVAAVLADLQERHAGLELELLELTSAQQLARSASHGLDVGIVHHPCDVSGLELGPVLRRELGVLLPGTDPAAGLAEGPLASLAGHDLILFPRSGAPALYDDLLTACARNGFTPGPSGTARAPVSYGAWSCPPEPWPSGRATCSPRRCSAGAWIPAGVSCGGHWPVPRWPGGTRSPGPGGAVAPPSARSRTRPRTRCVRRPARGPTSSRGRCTFARHRSTCCDRPP